MSDAKKKDKNQPSDPAKKEESGQQEETKEKKQKSDAPTEEQTSKAKVEEETPSGGEKQRESATAPKKLTRSRANRTCAGVCGGVAEYFELDVSLVRIGWLIAMLFGIGIPAYIVAWIVMPEQQGDEIGTVDHSARNRERSRNSGLIIGGALIFFGALILADNLHFYFPFRWMRYNFDYIFSLALIGLGAFLIFRHKKSKQAAGVAPEAPEASPSPTNTGRRFERSVVDKKIGGVCGGLASYFNVDSTIVRVGFIVLAIITQIIPALIAYILAMVLLPESSKQDALVQ